MKIMIIVIGVAIAILAGCRTATREQPVTLDAQVILPDCLIGIRVADDPALDGVYPVNELGAIQFGYVGSVVLDGQRETVAAKTLASALAKWIDEADVRVAILRISTPTDPVKSGVIVPVFPPRTAGQELGESIWTEEQIMEYLSTHPQTRGKPNK